MGDKFKIPTHGIRETITTLMLIKLNTVLQMLIQRLKIRLMLVYKKKRTQLSILNKHKVPILISIYYIIILPTYSFCF